MKLLELQSSNCEPPIPIIPFDTVHFDAFDAFDFFERTTTDIQQWLVIASSGSVFNFREQDINNESLTTDAVE